MNQTSSRVSTLPRSTSTKESDGGRGGSLPRGEEPLQKKKMCATALHPLPPRPARHRDAAHPPRHQAPPPRYLSRPGENQQQGDAASTRGRGEAYLVPLDRIAAPSTANEAREERGGTLRLKSGRIRKEPPSPPGTEGPPAMNANNYSNPRLQQSDLTSATCRRHRRGRDSDRPAPLGAPYGYCSMERDERGESQRFLLIGSSF
jgi:hypothetical protein